MASPASVSRRFSRRTLFRLAGAGALAGLAAEAGRVLFGSNEHTVIPGRVYRTAQLSEQKFKQVIAEKHIQTVINLRGYGPDQGWYLEETRATHDLGVSQEDVTLSAKRFPPPSEVLRLIDVLDRSDYPVLIHCAHGADRTGLASVIVKLLYTGDDLATARRQMWPRYGHVPIGQLAVLDRFFDYYETWLAGRGEAHSPERFRKWVSTAYCPGPYRSKLEVLEPKKLVFPAGRGFTVRIRATNVAIEPWVFNPGATGGIKFRYSLWFDHRALHRGQAGDLARTVNPGESIDFTAGFPPIPTPVEATLLADMLDAQALDSLETDFVQYGSEPLITPLVLKQATSW